MKSYILSGINNPGKQSKNNHFHLLTCQYRHFLDTRLHMARITVNKASQDFNVSRQTIYKHIKQSKITRDAEGKLDVSDLVVLYGQHVNNQHDLPVVDSKQVTAIEQLKDENMNLKQLLAVNEMLVNTLQKQIEDLKQDKQQLFNQLEQRLIETKIKNKSFLGKFFK